MKKIFLFALLSLLPFAYLPAQLQDDFSDGDFSNGPEWFGDAAKFVVANGELQLQDSGPAANNTAYLYLPAPTSTLDTTAWEFFVRLEFNPSGSNFARVYLSASNPVLAGDQEGYYLRAGGASGDLDAIELYRQDGASSVLLISGTPGAAAIGPVVARIRVTRSPAGRWELLADYTGGADFQPEGTADDSTYPMGSIFGLYCRYTSTRNEAFFFDDIWINPLFQDTEPPRLLSAEAAGAGEVLARFDEPLSAASASEAGNYELDNGIGQPAEAVFDTTRPAEVRLLLGAPMQNTQSYRLTATGISDAGGNIAPAQSLAFTYYDIRPAAPGDIVITELMPDPSPSAGLPEGEFVELYNRSDKVIDLATLAVSSGSSPAALPEYLLLPGSYVAICDDSFEGAFAALGPAVSVGSFPALANEGDEVRILDAGGALLFEMAYDESWYRDAARAGGGYSLELIQTEGPYDCSGNWRASSAAAGGTPGQANSWLGAVADDTPPALLRAISESAFELRLTFSEVMDEATLANPANYSLSPPLPVAEALPRAGAREALLLLEEQLAPGTAYQLNGANALADCMGNPLPEGSALRTGLSEAVEPLDVVINELLFNPESGGSDFIELFNRSGKVVNLNGLAVANTQKMTRDSLKEVSGDFLLFPGEYALLTEAPDDILARYTVRNPQGLFETALPPLDDDKGNATLRYNGAVIDAFDYTEGLHYPLLDIKDGVSLERISPGAPTQDAGNWHSAASTAGFATPAYQNSQFFIRPALIPEMITVANTTFSPDGDGVEDVLLIDYQTDQPGYTLNVHLYDSNGRLLRRLANNETLAARGSLKWDGVNEEGSRARMGIYVLWFELFTPDGRVERDKKAVVLAGKME